MWQMVGGDISEEMLVQAKNLSDKEKINVNYFKADLCNLKSYGKFNFITIIINNSRPQLLNIRVYVYQFAFSFSLS